MDMECVVQGIIETQHVEALEILLQGLCGVQRERLRVHELTLKSIPNLGSVSSEVRLLCDLDQPEPTWTVKHVGGAMRGAGADQISVMVRTMIESKVSKNALRMFYALGYKLDHELLKAGFAFHFHRTAHISVSVSSVSKMPKIHAIDEAVPVTPGMQIVDVTVKLLLLFHPSACALVKTVYLYGSCADCCCGCCISYVGWRWYYIVRTWKQKASVFSFLGLLV